jgi:hypothetical protein
MESSDTDNICVADARNGQLNRVEVEILFTKCLTRVGVSMRLATVHLFGEVRRVVKFAT